MEGFVTKRGHLITNWKVRWFVLDNGEIRYYKDRAEQVMKGRYILRADSILSFHSDMGLNRNIILIFTTSHPFRKKALYFSCDSPESKEAWFHALTRSVQALKNGGTEPSPPTTILPSMPLPGAVLANAIDTITNAFTSASDKQEAEDTAVLTAMTNNSNMERGRTRARPNTGNREQSPVRAERSRSVDLSDRRQAAPSKPVKSVGTVRRLNPTGLATTSSNDIEVNNTNNTYTAADYDSSDTDGSMIDGDNREGRSKSSSDAPRVRPLSSGKPSTPHTAHASNGHSASMLAEAANSPVLQKVAQRRSGTDNIFNSTSASSPMPNPTTPAACVDDLPRVSEIVAEEAHLTNSKKVTSLPTKAGAQSPKASAAESVSQKDAPIKPPKNASVSPKKPPSAEKPSSPVVSSSASNSNATASGGVEMDNPWIEAYTPEGELYYYHKVSRLARWDKPDMHIVEAMESRMKDLDLASERSIKERKEAIDRAKQREAENESIKSEKNAEIEKNVRAWSMDKQRVGRELSFPELLRDLAFILPPDLLLVVYDSQHKVILEALQEFNVNSPPAEVKKAYLRVVRFIHPDKLPTDLEMASKFLVERVFIHLTQKFDLYRKAHDLG